jgi:hypothetical protein
VVFSTQSETRQPSAYIWEIFQKYICFGHSCGILYKSKSICHADKDEVGFEDYFFKQYGSKRRSGKFHEDSHKTYFHFHGT